MTVVRALLQELPHENIVTSAIRHVFRTAQISSGCSGICSSGYGDIAAAQRENDRRRVQHVSAVALDVVQSGQNSCHRVILPGRSGCTDSRKKRIGVIGTVAQSQATPIQPLSIILMPVSRFSDSPVRYLFRLRKKVDRS